MRAGVVATVVCGASLPAVSGATTPGSVPYAPVIIPVGAPGTQPVADASTGSELWVLSSNGDLTGLNAVDGSQNAALDGATLGLKSANAFAVSGNSLWVVDGTTNRVVHAAANSGAVLSVTSGSASGLSGPDAVAVGAGSVWVANGTGNTVTRLNAVDGSVTTVIGNGTTTFAHPSAILVAGGFIFVANKGSNSVVALDAVTGAVVTTYSSPTLPLSAPGALASDGTNLWVVNGGSNSVTELLGAVTGKLTGVKVLGSGFNLVAPSSITPANGAMWITNPTINTVVGITTKTATLQTVLGSGPYGFATPTTATAVGSTLFVVDSTGGHLSSLNLASASAAVPSPPRSVVIVPANKSAVVSWSSPVSNGGSLVTSYTVTASTRQTCTVAASAVAALVTSCVFPSLALGTLITFSVVAHNVAGASTATTSASVRIAELPGAPGRPIAVAKGSTAKVTWAAASTNGSPVQHYVVIGSDGSTCATSGALSCLIPALALGVKVSFTVTATNGVGTGPTSAPSVPIVVFRAPSPPVHLQAATSSGSVTLTWLASVSNGGSPITSYVAKVIATGSTTAAATCTVLVPTGHSASVTTACTLGKLKNGTAYRASVVAVSAHGTSPAATLKSLTPFGVPGAPTHVVAVAANDVITVTWSPPTSTGGSAVTSYVASNGTDQCTATPTGADGTTSSGALRCNIPHVMPGSHFTVTVVAINAAGAGPSASVAGSFATVPSAPLDVTASTANAATTVSWVVPTNNGGTPITGYLVTDYRGHQCSVGALVRHCTFTGLTNGLLYDFEVAALNAQGQGVTVDVVVVPSVAPSAPMNVTAVAGDTQVTVSWDAELFPDNGGAPIQSYVVSTVGDAAATCTMTVIYGAPTQCTVTGLTDGVTYQFTVVAINAAGTSPPSAATPGVTPVRSGPPTP